MGTYKHSDKQFIYTVIFECKICFIGCKESGARQDTCKK